MAFFLTLSVVVIGLSVTGSAHESNVEHYHCNGCLITEAHAMSFNGFGAVGVTILFPDEETRQEIKEDPEQLNQLARFTRDFADHRDLYNFCKEYSVEDIEKEISEGTDKKMSMF